MLIFYRPFLTNQRRRIHGHMDKSHAFTCYLELHITTLFVTWFSEIYGFNIGASGASICPPEVSRWRETPRQC